MGQGAPYEFAQLVRTVLRRVCGYAREQAERKAALETKEYYTHRQREIEHELYYGHYFKPCKEQFMAADSISPERRNGAQQQKAARRAQCEHPAPGEMHGKDKYAEHQLDYITVQIEKFNEIAH